MSERMCGISCEDMYAGTSASLNQDAINNKLILCNNAGISAVEIPYIRERLCPFVTHQKEF